MTAWRNVAVRVPDDVHRRLQTAAVAADQTVSEYVRNLIVAAVDAVGEGVSNPNEIRANTSLPRRAIKGASGGF